MWRARLAILTILALVLLVAPFEAEAQPAPGNHRIGFLSPATPAAMVTRLDALLQGMAELGYRENENLVVEYRWAEGSDDSLPSLADELVQLKVAIISVPGVQAALRAMNA